MLTSSSGIRIIGGIYKERSVFPPSDLIYGSGGRAAAALSSMCEGIILTSFVGRDKSKDISYHARELWNADLDSIEIDRTVSFEYYHGLSTPIIRPVKLPIESTGLLHLKSEVILQFGMLEGNVVAEGERVVYDPQNPEHPHVFSEFGSKANHLCYVLNIGEARKLTGQHDSDSAAKSILRDSKAEAVVLKCGADGARVFTPCGIEHVAAYETELVSPIGSGDVFAAVFAYFWGVEKLTPLESATYASRGAALYCGRKALPLRRDDLVSKNFEYPALHLSRTPQESQIYLAGPFFTMGQLWLVEEARNALLYAGFNVFSPFHDIGLGEAQEVALKDLEGLEKSDVLLALCDGLDAGTLFEVGYAVAKGIPVIGFGEQTSAESMKMLAGSNCKLLNDFTSAIYHTQWEALK